MPKRKISPQYATKEDVEKIVTNVVTQASDAILSGIDEMLQNLVTKNEFNKLQTDVDKLQTDVDKLQTDVSEIKSDIHFMKDDIKNIDSDISVLPHRLEFEELKSRVNKTYV